MGRVSRNNNATSEINAIVVTSRMGRVSRNDFHNAWVDVILGHVPHGACE